MGSHIDPVNVSWFEVEFGTKAKGSFMECGGLGSKTQVAESYNALPAGKVLLMKIPGNLEWNDITLKRGMTNSMDFWKWRKEIVEGKYAEARVDGSLTLFDHNGKPVGKWNFTNAWPVKVSGPDLNSTANGVGVEELVITHEGYERVAP